MIRAGDIGKERRRVSLPKPEPRKEPKPVRKPVREPVRVPERERVPA